MVPVHSAAKDSGPIPQILDHALTFQLTVAWPASMFLASAPWKNSTLMTKMMTVGMMDCLNRMTTPFMCTAPAVLNVRKE